MSKVTDAPEHRRGTAAEEEAYLKLVGERVRLHRVRRGMSRKALSQASGVSERYLAELERGTGNASLLVLRQIAAAMDITMVDLTADDADRSIDLQLAIHQLEGLTPVQLTEARAMLAARFGRPLVSPEGRVAIVGLREPLRSSIGQETARALGVPLVDLDQELARISGMEPAAILAVHGQSVHHRLQQDCLKTIIDAYKRVVITTGGGVVTSPTAIELLLSSCFVIRAKTAAGAEADGTSVSEFTAAREAREPLLSKADCEIEVTGRPQAEVLGEIASALSRYATRATGT